MERKKLDDFKPGFELAKTSLAEQNLSNMESFTVHILGQVE